MQKAETRARRFEEDFQWRIPAFDGMLELFDAGGPSTNRCPTMDELEEQIMGIKRRAGSAPGRIESSMLAAQSELA